MARSVFYSFHYQRDCWRVQQIINMGVVEGQPLLTAQDWESVKKKGKAAIETWIKEKMAYKAATVVLIGSQTAGREWVQYEIAYAWDSGKPLVGVRIHGLADKDGKVDSRGPNPFEKVKLKSGETVGDYVPVFTPSGSTSQAVYADIEKSLPTWVASAKKR
jgi:hypothetical protein